MEAHDRDEHLEELLEEADLIEPEKHEEEDGVDSVDAVDDEEEEDEEEEEEEEGEEDEVHEEDLAPEMRQLMMMMKMMDRQQRRRDEKLQRRRDKEQKKQQKMMKESREMMKELLATQQEQHRKTLKALRPKETMDQSIPLPRRMEGDQTISEYLVGFEKIMKERGTPSKKWPAILPSLLNRKYNQALRNLDEEETDDYEIVKETLLAVDVEDLLMAPRKFFEAQKKQGEDFHKFCQKLETYWYHVTKAIDTIKKMRQKTIMERFITFLPHQCATAVRDKKPETTNAAINYAKEYFASRQWNINNYLGHGKWAETSGQRRQDYPRRQGGGYRPYQRGQQNYRGEQQRDDRGSQGRQQQTPETKPEEKKPEETQRQGNSKYTYRPTCFNCGKIGHTRKNCRSKVDVNLVNYLGNLEMDKLLQTSGVIEGKEVHDIALDTGADVCVVSSDLVPANAEKRGTLTAGTIGGKFPFPKVVVHATIKGRQMKLEAVSVPRELSRETFC